MTGSPASPQSSSAPRTSVFGVGLNDTTHRGGHASAVIRGMNMLKASAQQERVAGGNRLPAKGKTMSDVDLRLSEYKDNYLLCRDLRHHWKVLGYYSSDGEMKRRLQCQNCPTGAIDTISGWRTKRSYTYPDDYHLKGKVSVHEVRQEAIARAKVFESQEALEKSLPRKYKVTK